MKLANEIQKKLMFWARGSNDIIIPNFYWGMHECDLFKITGSEFVIEYEIKISRSDFSADFKKGFGLRNKHQEIFAKKGANRFFFVVPENLVQADEVPKHAGLIYYNHSFSIIKNAPLLHKNKFTHYRKIATTLAYRDEMNRGKINRIRNNDLESELSSVKRQLENMHTVNRENNNSAMYAKIMARASLRLIEEGKYDEAQKIWQDHLNKH